MGAIPFSEIKSTEASSISLELRRSVFFANPFFLTASCLAARHESETVIAAHDNPDEILMFLPQHLALMGQAKEIFLYSEAEIRRLQDSHIPGLQIRDYSMEFFYSTKRMIELNGPDYR